MNSKYYFHIVQSYHTCLPAISLQRGHFDTALHSGVQQIHLCQDHAFCAFAIPKWVSLPTSSDHDDQPGYRYARFALTFLHKIVHMLS